jgi:hypothetical protein
LKYNIKQNKKREREREVEGTFVDVVVVLGTIHLNEIKQYINVCHGYGLKVYKFINNNINYVLF